MWGESLLIVNVVVWDPWLAVRLLALILLIRTRTQGMFAETSSHQPMSCFRSRYGYEVVLFHRPDITVMVDWA